jgi:hypothetical protein
MGDSQTEQVEPESRVETRGEDTLSGLEINLGDFTRTQGLLKSLRLLINNQVTVSVDDVASGVGEAGRKFKMGDIEEANQDVTRLFSSFGQKVNQWDSQARGLEQQMRMQAAKNPKSISIDKMNRMKSEQTAVRTRIRTAEVQFRRLHQGLDQAFTNLQRRSAALCNAASALPAGFLARFKAATLTDRAQVIKESFNVEAILSVTVTRSAMAGYDIKFDPLPPLNRIYFLAQTRQLINLERVGSIVIVQDLETGQKSEMKLVEFVKQVQSGVWLLKSRV